MDSIFFYGTLRDRVLLDVVLGRKVDPAVLEPAWLAGYAAMRLTSEVYPMLLPEPGARAEGVVFSRVSAADFERLAFFEEAEYALTPVTVMTVAGPVETQYFRGTEKPAASTVPWDFGAWEREHRDAAVECAREYMHHFGRWPVEEIDRIWPGIKIRGYQRANALAETSALGSIRTSFSPADVEIAGFDRAYTSYLSVQEFRLRHRRFDEGWTGYVGRSVAVWGDAITVLPYDPRRDRVLLIEQFRPGALARGDRNPWCIEVVAGRIDAREGAEATARREAMEEAGLELGRVVELGRYYATPGLSAEYLTAFVGEAELDRPGAVHGLEAEGEDIRTIVLGFEQAMAEAAAGAVNTGPALVSLLWLAAIRERLRGEWGDVRA